MRSLRTRGAWRRNGHKTRRHSASSASADEAQGLPECGTDEDTDRHHRSRRTAPQRHDGVAAGRVAHAQRRDRGAVGGAPEMTGNTKTDLEAQQRFNKQLLRALDYLLGQIDQKLEEKK